jgi:ATP-dependent Clp protease protease subunit
MYIPNFSYFLSRRNVIFTIFLMSLNPTPLNDDNMATNSPQTLITKTDKEIYFYGPLTDESCFRLHYTLEELIKINKDKNNEIDLYLQTGGGSVLPTFPVVDLIKSSDIPINTIIKGYCASAGTLISVAGNKRYMTNNSLLLIHSLRQETGEGTFNNIKDTFENSDVIMKLIKNIYLENTEIPEEKLNYFFDHDLWLTSDECLKLKIVDGIKN